MDRLDETRTQCPMRHANGNCLTVGGFCTSVNEIVCKAVRNGYNSGYEDGYHAARMNEVSRDIYPGHYARAALGEEKQE
ncbi:MAG: hypothetical protein ABFC56_09785 [Clostridiaceae bacterium]